MTIAVVTSGYSGAQVLVTDQAGKQRISQTDGLGRLTDVWEVTAADSATESVTFPGYSGITAGYRTTYSYDALDDLTLVTQKLGTTPKQTRTFAYNGLKRLTDATNPESNHVQYTYDANSNLQTKTDARSITTTYTYDALNRVTSRTYSDATPAVSFKYDAQTLPTGAPSFTRGSSTGRLVSVTYGGGSAGSYTGYDQLGRTNVSYQQTDSNNYGFGYGYNLGSEMTTETYPSGRLVQTEFDSAGRVAGVRNQSASWYYAGGAATDASNRIQYASHGAISAMKLGNGKWEHTTFDAKRLQPTRIGLGTSSSDSSILQLDYSYGTTSNNANLLSQTITIGSTVMTQSYGYDALNRLSSASETGAASWSQNYGYDRFGNRWYSSGSYLPNSTLTPQSQSAFDQSTNKLIASFYDNAGNQITDAASSDFTFDAENRQISSNVGGTVTYSYDGDGRRVKKAVGTSTTIFVYDVGGQLIAEYTSGAPTGSGTSYLTSDHLGSTRVVTDGNGNVKSRHDYLPFGEEIDTAHCPAGLSHGATDGVRQKFTQKERDNESGLDYFLARYYSSAQGRFTSPDEFAGGPHEFWVLGSGDTEKQALPYADITNPQSLNKYHYAFNNPLRYVDPDGHQEGAALRQDQDVKDLAEGRITEKEFRDRQTARGVAALVGAAIVAAPRIGGAILSWIMRNPSTVMQVGEDVRQASNGNPAPINQMALAEQIPKLAAGTGRQMLGEAITALKSSTGNAAQKADLFEALGRQITQHTKGSWEAARSAGTDGSHIFAGGQGELLVINSKGQLFRGRIQDGGVTFGKGGTFTPNYQKLKEIK